MVEGEVTFGPGRGGAQPGVWKMPEVGNQHGEDVA